MKEKILASTNAIKLSIHPISKIGEFYNGTINTHTLSLRNGFLETMNQSISKGSRDILEGMLTRKTIMPLLILSVLFFVQSWSGAIVVFFYGVSIFQVSNAKAIVYPNLSLTKFYIHIIRRNISCDIKFFRCTQEAGISLNAYYATVIIGIIMVLGSSLSCCVINKTGRKPLLISSLLICCVSMTIIGGCYYNISWHGKQEVSVAPWLALVCLILFTLSFTIGLAPVPWVLVGELLPGKN